MKYVIWGCGKQGRNIFYAFGKEKICAFIESNIEKQGTYFEETLIISYENFYKIYKECIVIVSPAKDVDDIVRRLEKDNIFYMLIDSIPSEIRTGWKKDIFATIDNRIVDIDKIYLYSLSAYNLLLCEHFREIGKQVSIILEKNENINIPKQYDNLMVEYKKHLYDNVCVTNFWHCDKLREENVVPLFALEDYPFISRPSEALEIPKNFLNQTHREKKIIISLTTYEQRLESVSYAIGTMMRQTMKPDKIILYMSEKCKDILPIKLQEQIEKGVEIRYVDDIKSHKKYYYVMQEYPNDIIITIDDDIFYRLDTIEKLYMSYLKFPTCVSTITAERITYDDDGNINPTSEWIRYEDGYGTKGVPSKSLSAIGASGILYPPECMDEELFCKDIFMKLCPKADDIWLKFMQLLKGTSVVLAVEKRHSTIEVDFAQVYGLRNYNIQQGGNDIQILKLLERYGERIMNELNKRPLS